MQHDYLKEYGFLSEEEISEMNNRFKKTEEEGLKNVLKHFDRIHDKVFSFNNILIAGYFVLAKFDNSLNTPISTIIIPIINMAFLIWIEYRMMEKSRFESEMTKKSLTDINSWGKKINSTNLFSLLIIITTTIVTIIFLYYFLKI